MRLKTKLKKLLIFAVCASMVMSSMTAFASSGKVAETREVQGRITRYYSSWDEAYKALKEYCGVGDPSQYTDEQGDLVSAFLNKWPDILYNTTEESEANMILAQAKAEFEELPLDDEEAMKEHKKFIEERDAAFKEKEAVMNENIANADYTSSSRFEYEQKARTALGKILRATDRDIMNAGKEEFDACVSLLKTVDPTIKAAQNAAKEELRAWLASEYEGVGSVDVYCSRIDQCDSIEEINGIIDDCKEYLAEYVNKNITEYRSIKRTKVAEYDESFKTTLGNKYNELHSYISSNIATLNTAKTKAEVDAAYSDLITKIDAKVAELTGGTSKTEGPTVVEVTKVELNKTTLTLKVEGQEQLTATVTPENATDKTVVWSTDNADVATVSNGLVVAKSVGTANITAKCGEKTATCAVTVEAKQTEPENPKVDVVSVTLDKVEMSLTEGETGKLTATVDPVNATDKKVSWKSSNTSVVTVDEDGNLNAVKAGTATISAEADGKSATCAVTVKAKQTEPENPKVDVASVTLNKKTLTLEEGETEKLTATINPTDATNKTLTWKTSDSNVATVDKDGNVKAVSAGTTAITVEVDGKVDACMLTVTAKKNEPENTVIKVESVSLNKTKLSLKEGETDNLTVTINPSNATNKDTTWKSSDSKVVTVDANGNLKAVKTGTAMITVTVDNKTDVCTVTVVATTNNENNGSNSGSTNETNKKEDSKTETDNKNDKKEDKKDNKKEESKPSTSDTYAEAKVVDNGKTKNLVIKYTKLAIPDLSAYKKAIGNTQVACFFDVTAWINGKNETELDSEATFTLPIPSEFLKDGRRFYLVRNHNGRIDRLNDIDDVANTITVKSSDFSGYLLTYTDTAVKENVSPATGDNSNIFVYASVAAVAIMVMFYCTKKKEY